MTIELLKLVVSVFPDMKVETFNERFGACSYEEIRAYTLQQKRQKRLRATHYVVTDRGCVKL